LGCHPVAVVQYTFTHKQYTERHKTIHRTTQQFWRVRAVPRVPLRNFANVPNNRTLDGYCSNEASPRAHKAQSGTAPYADTVSCCRQFPLEWKAPKK